MKYLLTRGGVGLMALLVLLSPISAKDFYINPTTGKDTHPGTKEKPFATLVHAQKMVRSWRPTNEDITVWLAGGEYLLSETLVFGIEDGGQGQREVTYRSLPGETPIISSDVHISGWRKLEQPPVGLPENVAGHIWVGSVPSFITDFKVMFDRGGMLPRARTSAFKHLREVDNWVGDLEEHATIPFGAEAKNSLFNPSNAEVIVIPSAPWTMNILPVKSFDPSTGMVHLASLSSYAIAAPRFYMEPTSIWLENVFAGLDEPGEWVYDKRAGLVYYWPKNGDKPGDDVVVPGLIELFRVEGHVNVSSMEDTPVRGLHFKGLTFTHGDRFESAGQTGRGLQHDWERFDESTAIFRFRGAAECAVENCTFANAGGAGIRLDLYAQKISISKNHFYNLGGGGILLAGYGPGKKDVNKYNVIYGNHIHDIGRLWWHSIGVWAWQSGNNLISRNTIHHVPYTAIAVTGRISWDRRGKGECSGTIRWSEVDGFSGSEPWEERERFLHGRQNILEHNDIYHIMDQMQDGNGIYISGAGYGNVVRRNYIHDTPSTAAGEAIRCDDDQNEVIVESNVVFRFGTHGIGICSKGRNHIFNNIVACPPQRVNRGMLSFEPTDPKVCAGSRVYHNIFLATQPDQPVVWQEGYQLVAGTIYMDRNIYFNNHDDKFAIEHMALSKTLGNDANSIIADPMFNNIEQLDFSLKPGSPAISLGFRPFSLDAGIASINLMKE